MSITAINISQDNIINGSDLLPVQSPIAFIVDVTYTDVVPDDLTVEIYSTDGVNMELLDTYRAIPYKDPLTTVRQFAFKASEPIKSLMGPFDDIVQNTDTLINITDITKRFLLKFIDPDNAATYDEIEVSFLHGAAQFGEAPNKESIFNNDTKVYYSLVDGFAYVYFYNDDITNNLTVSVS
jgi:hypothetical protein